MAKFKALREASSKSPFKKGDYFILFGELFGRGYANGLVEQARKAGMNIISMSMGRRNGSELRPLTPEEIESAENLVSGKLINIPLEAGFDMDPPEGSSETPASMMASIKLDGWESFAFDDDFIAESRKAGLQRFKHNLALVVQELEKIIEPGRNVFFAHTMAGGVPRAKIILALTNRIYKGRGDRFLSSAKFWNHSLGKLVATNFVEVTANTFDHLINATEGIRKKAEQNGAQVYYSAYGYHGTEILINDEYKWQTYTPYKQGYAKIELENIAERHRKNGVNSTVFNCPEIRTNSSDLFAGVELSLFPLLKSFDRHCTESSRAWVNEQHEICNSKLKEEFTIESTLDEINSYLTDSALKQFFDFENWPKDNTIELAEIMVGTSERMVKKHINPKDLISDYLSSIVLVSSGDLIFNYMANATEGAIWLGHDVIAKKTIELH